MSTYMHYDHVYAGVSLLSDWAPLHVICVVVLPSADQMMTEL